ncbi:hypothetical protein RB595_007141 [Gaeumannomyces hyphopodioides]
MTSPQFHFAARGNELSCEASTFQLQRPNNRKRPHDGDDPTQRNSRGSRATTHTHTIERKKDSYFLPQKAATVTGPPCRRTCRRWAATAPSSTSELAREKMWARIHLIPVLQAEEDRDLVRRHLADQARERELLGENFKVYNSDRYVRPTFAATPTQTKE